MVVLRRQRESVLVAQILKTPHFFDSRPKLTRAGWMHSCTSGQKWDRTSTYWPRMKVGRGVRAIRCCSSSV